MANISIVDTGFITPYHVGSLGQAVTQISSANRANSGNKMVLKTVSFNPNIKLNVDDTPEIDKSEAVVNIGTVENLKFTLNGVLDMSNSTDRGYVYQMLRLCKTKAYKALFYDVIRTSSEAQNLYQILTQITGLHYNGDGNFPGDSNQGDISFNLWSSGTEVAAQNLTNVYHLHVIFTDVTFTDTADKSLKRYVLTGVVTG